jgi:C4-type Zn-finger protein
MEKRAPTTLTCPQCAAVLRHVRTIPHLGDLPDIEIFFCAACSHAETAQLKRAA